MRTTIAAIRTVPQTKSVKADKGGETSAAERLARRQMLVTIATTLAFLTISSITLARILPGQALVQILVDGGTHCAHTYRDAGGIDWLFPANNLIDNVWPEHSPYYTPKTWVYPPKCNDTEANLTSIPCSPSFPPYPPKAPLALPPTPPAT